MAERGKGEALERAAAVSDRAADDRISAIGEMSRSCTAAKRMSRSRAFSDSVFHSVDSAPMTSSASTNIGWMTKEL